MSSCLLPHFPPWRSWAHLRDCKQTPVKCFIFWVALVMVFPHRNRTATKKLCLRNQNSHWREQMKGVERIRPSKTSKELRKLTEWKRNRGAASERLVAVSGCVSRVLRTNNGSKGILQRKWKYVKGCEFPDLLEIINDDSRLLPRRSVWRHQLSLSPPCVWVMAFSFDKTRLWKGEGIF